MHVGAPLERVSTAIRLLNLVATTWPVEISASDGTFGASITSNLYLPSVLLPLWCQLTFSHDLVRELAFSTLCQGPADIVSGLDIAARTLTWPLLPTSFTADAAKGDALPVPEWASGQNALFRSACALLTSTLQRRFDGGALMLRLLLHCNIKACAHPDLVGALLRDTFVWLREALQQTLSRLISLPLSVGQQHPSNAHVPCYSWLRLLR